MPGMRTSMITTSGVRRSASSTALAPSAASPTMRMCGARESESRRPSRTTSWSSTISVVISSGMRAAIVCVQAAIQACQSRISVELLGRRRRLEPHAPAVADAVRAGELAHDASRAGAASALRQVRAPRVEPLVLGQELRPVAGEALEEVLARAGLAGGAGSPRSPHAPASRAAAHDRRELLGRVRDARAGSAPSRPRRGRRRRRARDSARSRCRGGAVPGSVRRQTSSSSVGTENVTETSARRAASASTSTSRTISGPRVISENGFAAAREHLEARARQPVAALGRLVRVGRGADRDRLAVATTRRASSRAQHLGDVDLDPDRRAVAVVGRPVGAPLEGADVTERAAVGAAHVRVERPVERHALARGSAPTLHGSSRYSARIAASIEHMFVSGPSAGRTRLRSRSAWTTTCRPVRARRRAAPTR